MINAEVALCAALAECMKAWRISARVSRARDGSTCIDGLGPLITVKRADDGLPFRWIVEREGRGRPALSVVSVLRQVRQALDPTYAKMRLRVPAPQVTPPS